MVPPRCFYVAAILLVASALSARAADEIQVYNAEIAKVGQWTFQLHNNYAFIGRKEPDFPGGLVPNHALQGTGEWAYGITDWWEMGFYTPYAVDQELTPYSNAIKIRQLFVIPNAAEREFFYGVNFEFSHNTRHWDTKSFTAEIRPIIGWRTGRMEFILNPILDYTSQGAAGLDFAPATRLAYRITPAWSVAAEEYDDFGPLRRFAPAAQQSHQLFAVLDHPIGRTDIEAGVGFGLTAGSDGLVLKLILARDLN